MRLAVISRVVKAINKKNLKNAEKVRFYKGLTHFQNAKDCQDQLRKIGRKKHEKPTATTFCINIHNLTKYAICMHKTNKTLEKGHKYTRPTFHYTHSFRQTLKTPETNWVKP